MFVNVAINIPSEKTFTYEVPANLQNEIEIGKRVFVPFGNKKRTGFIVGINQSCDLENIKLISEILDDAPSSVKAILIFTNGLPITSCIR